MGKATRADDMQEQLDHIADAGAASSILLFAGLTLAHWESIVHITAGFAATFAGVTAGIYHIHRWRKERRNEREKRRQTDTGK
jgi:hypothetical protein